MKTVRLPIYEDGTETNQVLEIDVIFFISSHRGLRNTQARIVPKEKKDAFTGHPVIAPEVEVDTLDRIVHDLPAVNTNDWIGPALARRDKSNPWKVHRSEILGEFPKEEEPHMRGYVKPGDMIYYGPNRSIDEDIRDQLMEKAGRVPYVEPTKDWRPIPGFERYVMTNYRTIMDTTKELEPVPLMKKSNTRREYESVMLYKGEHLKHMNVTSLFNRTFPELAE